MVYRGKIDGEFEGFDDGKLFRMDNGTYWLQNQYQYWYYYEFRPDASISQEHGGYVLTVAGKSVPVVNVDVIESRIEGKFEGWDGNSTYKLINGQIWQQSVYKYQYKYAYRPETLIYRVGGSYVMHVAGTEAKVKRVK